MKRLSVIGCGHLGRTLARLWHEAGLFELGELLTRSPASGERARSFVGAGRAVQDMARLAAADLFLVATPDDALGETARGLTASGVLRPGDVVFHASGATPSAVLDPVRAGGAVIASVHPVLSFASPEKALTAFAGTWCGVEGEETALSALRPAFTALGARLFDIDARAKPVYHAAAVLACNYLPVLIECALRAYGHAGVGRDTGMAILEPIVRGTVDNVFSVGPAMGLSGPVARGDHQLVERQLAALAARDPTLCGIYRELATIAVGLAREQGHATPESLDAIDRLLASSGGSAG